MVTTCEDGKGWVGLIVIDKGNNGADGGMHGDVVALRASRIRKAEGAEGGRPKASGSCSRAAPAGDSEVKRSVCSTGRSRVGVPRESGRWGWQCVVGSVGMGGIGMVVVGKESGGAGFADPIKGNGGRKGRKRNSVGIEGGCRGSNSMA